MTSLWIRVIFLILLLEYIHAAPSLGSALQGWVLGPQYGSRFYLPPQVVFLTGIAFMALIEWGWLYAELPAHSADSDDEGTSSSAIEETKR